jgi:starch synthase
MRSLRVAVPVSIGYGPIDSNYERGTSLRVLHAGPEIYPLAKTGGLGDVCAALPTALAELGAEVRLLIPGYESALDRVLGARVVASLEGLPGIGHARIIAARMPDSALPVWLVDCPTLFHRDGGPYQDARGVDWPDNALRFAVFCHVAARLAAHGDGTGWMPDIVHSHDWPGGLLPLLLAESAGAKHRARSVFTVHNAAFQGNFPLDQAARLGIPPQALHGDGIEFYGQLSFLKAGINHADRVTTVSPRYARELATAEFGCGMEGLFLARAAGLSGIMNGIDDALWNPRTDIHLAARFATAQDPGKAACKRHLQESRGLQVDPQRPLALLLSRLTRQKMADVVLERLPEMLTRMPDLQFMVLGRGDADLEQGFAAVAQHWPGRFVADIGYSEHAAHCAIAGADVLVHASRFEPCGLTQMYAMRYGTIPVVRRVGGLADSVVDAGPYATTGGATGFVFDACSGDALVDTLERALETRARRPDAWRVLQWNAMGTDFGWSRPAREYLRLYQSMSGETDRAAVSAPRPQTVRQYR